MLDASEGSLAKQAKGTLKCRDGRTARRRLFLVVFVVRRGPLERVGNAGKSERALLPLVLVRPTDRPPSKKSSQIQFGLSIMVRRAGRREGGRARGGSEGDSR